MSECKDPFAEGKCECVLCAGDTPNCEDEINRRRLLYDDQMAAMLSEMPFMVQGVGGGEGSYPFCYTIGLTRLGLPEMFIVGHSGLNQMFNALHNAHGAEEIDLSTATEYHYGTYQSGPKEGEEVFLKLLPVEPLHPWVMLNMTGTQRHCGHPLGWHGVRQVVWPDDEGRYPWQTLEANAVMIGPVPTNG